jgi:predicted metal-binding protein
MTVDMIGLFKNQEAARVRFEVKHDKQPKSHLFVCSDCEDENPHYAQNSREKYGVY